MRLALIQKNITQLYQFKIILEESKPPIWRRVLVPSTLTLKQMHDVIQACFGWEDCHLYNFEVLGRHFNDEVPNSLSTTIHSVGFVPKNRFRYTYNFIDNWYHLGVLEKILSNHDNSLTSHCLKGKGASPPEDCGGIWGYEDKLKILSDIDHPEYEEIVEWMGDDFDPRLFDLKEVNSRLSQLNEK